MKNSNDKELRTITVAELCAALATGAIPAHRDGDDYVIRSGDLRHFVHRKSHNTNRAEVVRLEAKAS